MISRLWIILYIISHRFEERQHRHRYKVHIDSHFTFSDFINHPVALFFGKVLNTQSINVIRAFLFPIHRRRNDGPVTSRKSIAISIKHPLSFFQQFRIFSYLCQSYGGIYIGHIDFHPETDNIITPSSGFRFRKSILGLAVQACHP